MEKKNKFWICLIVAVVSLVMLSGCVGLIEIAKVDIVIRPNPVPYSSQTGGWSYFLAFTETGGVGVTFDWLRFDPFNQEDQLLHTTVWYAEDNPFWGGSNYLDAFTLSGEEEFSHNSPEIKYTIITISGIDDNDNSIEATARVDFLPEY